MSYQQLFEHAHKLCERCKSHAIAHSLQLLSKAELACVIGFLSQIVS